MQLTGELKEKVETAKSAEDAKKILEEAGMILDDAELDQVAGGMSEGINWGLERAGQKPNSPQGIA